MKCPFKGQEKEGNSGSFSIERRRTKVRHLEDLFEYFRRRNYGRFSFDLKLIISESAVGLDSLREILGNRVLIRLFRS